MGFIYKKFCIYSYVFKLKSHSKYSPFEGIQPIETFFLLKTVLNLSILMPFSASAVFVSPLRHWQNVFSFENSLFRETKKVIRGEIG